MMFIPNDLDSLINNLLTDYRRIVEQEINFQIKSGKIKIIDTGIMLVRHHDRNEISLTGSVKLELNHPEANKLEEENKMLREKLAKFEEILNG